MKQKGKHISKLSSITVPHTCVIIFAIIILCAVLTYIIPAGQYTYVENASGNLVIDPNSYTATAASPTTLYQLFNAIPAGLVDMSSLIFFVFIAGGSFSIINDTGTLQLAIDKIAYRLHNREKLMVFIIMTVFSMLGGLMGFSTECIIFIPMGIALARRVGYDDMVGTAMILMGTFVGFSCGTFNPYTTAVAQGILGLPTYSGLPLRAVFHAITLLAVYLYTIRYAIMVKKDPKKSYVYRSEENSQVQVYELTKPESFTPFHFLVLFVMLICFSIMIFGALFLSWSTSQMAPVLFAMGVLSGLVGKLNPNKIAQSWLSGAKDMVFASLIIGMGRGVLIIMQDGMIMDTIVYELAELLQALPSFLTAIGMLISNIVINFFVPSGSGQATLVMPIMGSIAHICGISLQISILAFQCGDGFTNAIIPTSSVTTSCIGIANISYTEWIRFAFPIVAIEWGISAAVIIFAELIGY